MKILRRLTCGTAVWVLLASVHFAQTTQAPKTGQKAGEAKSDSSSKSGTPQSPDPTAKAGTSQGADAAPKPQQTPAAQSSGAAGQDSQANKGVAQTGMDRPAILVQADTDEATTKILLRVDAKPVQSDLETGLLTSTQFPKLQVRPSVTLVGDAEPGKAGEFLVQLKIGGLVAFGDSSTPLLYKGRQVELLRFSKPGLFAKPPVGDAFVAREGEPLTILLENPSAFGYSNVRARLRFENEDVCLFKSESFRQAASTAGQPDASQPQSCDANSKWTEFEIPQYAQVSLHADPSTSWFFDSATGYAR
ncbi:MAG TPA: hypothetical protein VF532_10160, partial [Candidatus Angelobacter sp.]